MPASASNSEVHIANRSLAQINEGPVTSIEAPTTNTEVIVAEMFADIRQEMLRAYPFNFAKKRTSIAKISGDAPAFDFDSYYQLPADFLRLLSIEGDKEVYQDLDYDIEGSKILYASTANSIRIRYVRDVENVGEWDALFKKCIVLALAIDLAGAITNKSTAKVVEVLDARLTQAIRQAVAVDGQERPPLVIDRSPTLAARRSLSSGDMDNRFIRF